ncbi:hypothetical protein ABD76_27185 [Paenibacillus dendritiformis]|uniref:aminotransferase class III-fold pyridoxal phosphate-dependent enzyme n=1 Tax=Paenibacillus dendritiformis TaxID=130049 RepID=UPI0018CF7F57|nr:aminotransferase class III-fold pyridoxal phosphate-dependent enzyme [Paenibacillus dendritiformis]MBG9795930.1 hypothetical protein [Paenibacillus dendritiformis]
MGHIKIKTSLPGPRSRQRLSEMASHVAKAKVERTLVPAIIESASGALINDLDGNTWIDLAGGVGAMNVGHSHPLVITAGQLDEALDVLEAALIEAETEFNSTGSLPDSARVKETV